MQVFFHLFGDGFQPFGFILNRIFMGFQFPFQGFSFLNQLGDIRVRVQGILPQFLEDIGIHFFIEVRADPGVHMVFPPLFSVSNHLREVGIAFRHLERNRNRVLHADLVVLRVVVILRLKEACDHDHIVHSQQVGVERSLYCVVFRDILFPILAPLGGFHFQHRGHFPVLVPVKVVPHPAENFAFREEISVGLVKVILAVFLRRGQQVEHGVAFLHELCLFRLDCLTSEGVLRILKGFLIGLGDLAPCFEGSVPFV